MSMVADVLRNEATRQQARAASLRKIMAETARYSDTLDLIVELIPGVRLMLIDGAGPDLTVILCVPTRDMADVRRLLESLEKRMGIAFDRSEDIPDGGWRTFSSSALPWFRVDAEVQTDDEAANCKRVIIGYKTVPEYELRCADTKEADHD